MDYTAQHILILGLGGSGLSMARWCALQGTASICVIDTRNHPPMLQKLQSDVPAATFFTADFNDADIVNDQITAILPSPGISPQQMRQVMQVAQSKNITVYSELDLFFDALESLNQAQQYKPKVLGITGTNGKTTVTSLCHKLVDAAGKTSCIAGNIGPALLDTLTDKILSNKLPEVWVLELSSFQLYYAHAYSMHAACVLNISQDHLDWHKDMADYTQAKTRLLEHSQVRIFNRDDIALQNWANSNQSAPDNKTRRKTPLYENHSFGNNSPTIAGDFGIESFNGIDWLVKAQADESALESKRGKGNEQDATQKAICIQKLMPTQALQIQGRHNALNALAALALAQSVDCALAPMLFALREYRGEPHRVEAIAKYRDIVFIDDSKGTNVGATAAALQGLGIERKLIPILGGLGKGQDFSPLIEPLSKYARAAILIGKDANQFESILNKANVTWEKAKDLHDAVSLAVLHAQAGDAVLLSPACASLDMFEDYVHRAKAFASAVHEFISTQNKNVADQDVITLAHDNARGVS